MNCFELSHQTILKYNVTNGTDIALFAFFIPFSLTFTIKSLTKIDNGDSITYLEDGILDITKDLYIEDKQYDWEFFDVTKLEWHRASQEVNYLQLKIHTNQTIYTENNRFAIMTRNVFQKFHVVNREPRILTRTFQKFVKLNMPVMKYTTCTYSNDYDDCPFDIRTGDRMKSCMIWRREGIEGEMCNKKLLNYHRDTAIRNFCYKSSHPDCYCYKAYNTEHEKYVISPVCWHKDCIFQNYLIETERLKTQKECLSNPDWFWYLTTIIQPDGEFNGFIPQNKREILLP